MGWLIAAAIILLILIILTLKLSVRVKLRDDVSLILGIGIFKKKLLPSKEKEVRLSDYKIDKFRKNKDKHSQKSQKKSKKKSATKALTSTEDSAAKEKPERDIMGLISKLLEVVKVLFKRFGHHLRIKVKRVHIIVASEDAATTAVLYGAVCGAVQCLFEFLYNCMHLTLPKSEEMQVVPDFTSEKIKAEIDITFSFRLWQIFDILLRSAWTYIKQSMNK